MAEPWDKSREKAKELRLEQWGTPEEVKAMAAIRLKRLIYYDKKRTLVCDGVVSFDPLHPSR